MSRFPPVFQTRLKQIVFGEDSNVTFHCVVVGKPRPEINWFHNDSALVASERCHFRYEKNRASVTIYPAFFGDAGVYTCSASNSYGQTSCSARLKLGDLPSRPTRPDVELASDTEVFVVWEPPTFVAGTLEIIAYKLEYRKAGENEWSCPWHLVADSIDEEAVVIRHLEPMGIYQFRVTAKNCFGWGDPSLASRIIRTHPKGAPKLNIEILKSERHLNVVALSRQTGTSLAEIPEDVEEGSNESSPAPPDKEVKVSENGYKVELIKSEDPNRKYQLESEIFRGRFCLVRNAVDKKSESSSHCVAKIILATPSRKEAAIKEFENLRAAQHENVVTLLSAYLRDDFLLLFQERLHETVLQRFTYRDFYTEDHVSRTINQLVSALQWMHFKGLVHLDIQPDNIMFTGKRCWHVKLSDFGSAVQLSYDTLTRPTDWFPWPDYTAPELLMNGPVCPLADSWGFGIITFILLSGLHPFASEEDNQDDIIRNVTQDRLDINYIHTNASEESLRFVTWALRKRPNRRMTTEEALSHRWLSSHDAMGRRREHIKIPSNRLRKFAFWYQSQRVKLATQHNQLLSTYGTSL